MHVRELQYKDLQGVAECLQLLQTDEDRKNEDYNIETVYNLLDEWLNYWSDRYKIFVLIDKGMVMGTATLTMRLPLHRMKMCARIEEVAVRKEYQGHGYGEALVYYLSSVAKENNCYKITLDCADHNIGFYTKCDFNIVGKEMRQNCVQK